MRKILDINKIDIKNNHISYEGEKIGKWWGKLLYHYDSKNDQLYYENFSPLTLFLHIFGYKKEFNNEGLKEWLIAKDLNVQQVKDAPKNSEVALKILSSISEKKHLFTELCANPQITDEELIDLFKNKNLDVNAILDNKNTTVLHKACFNGRIRLAEYLITHGAQINAKRLVCDAITPLEAACLKGNAQLILLLLERGADVNATNYYDEPVLYWAIDLLKNEGEVVAIVQAILNKGVNIDAPGRKGTPLYLACERGYKDVVKLLLDKGADVNGIHTNRYGSTIDAHSPLFAVVRNGNLDIAKLLFEHQVNPNPKRTFFNIFGKHEWPETLFKVALGSGEPNQDMLRLLSEKGSHINEQSGGDKSSALHIAVQKGFLEAATVLLELHADPNIQDSHGYTPLHIAAEQGDLNMIKLLIEKGADFTKKNGAGKTPLNLAKDKNRLEVKTYLKELAKVK